MHAVTYTFPARIGGGVLLVDILTCFRGPLEGQELPLRRDRQHYDVPVDLYGTGHWDYRMRYLRRGQGEYAYLHYAGTFHHNALPWMPEQIS